MARLRCPNCKEITDHVTTPGGYAMCEQCMRSGPIKERLDK